MIIQNQPDLKPRVPDGVQGVQVCSLSGAMPGTNPALEDGGTCQTRFEYLIRGTENIGSADIKKEQVPINKDLGTMTKFDDPLAELQEHTLIWDGLSNYCLDCAHEQESNTTVTVYGKEPDTTRPTGISNLQKSP